MSPEENTTHGFDICHSFDIPHKFPNTEVSDKAEVLRGITDNLYPTGRAFYAKKGGVFDNFKIAISNVFSKYLLAVDANYDSVYPDNENFTEEDADIWEYQLGITEISGLDLDIRKNNILLKLGYPNNVESRTSLSFIQSQLNNAGFDLFVHENTFPYINPSDITLSGFTQNLHGFPLLHGSNTLHGGGNFQVIANSLESNEQHSFSDSSQLYATFFIGGSELGEFAEVDAIRERELREIIMKIKPLHTAAFIFINFI